MIKTLIVMRHAKSGWDTPLPDFERPLNDRGRLSAKTLGDWLRAQGLDPDEVLCSSATRTQETASGLDLATPPTLSRGLYHASAETLMEHIREATGDVVLVVAHNPGIAEFAERLAPAPHTHPRFYDYPTGATTVFQCDVARWSDLRFGVNSITDFVIPREL